MNKLILIATLLLIGYTADAQYTRLKSGMDYRIVKKGKGTKTAKVGDYISIILKGSCSGQTLFDTKQINKGNNSPVNFPVQKPTYNGDVMEILALLHEGDSAVILIPQDSFYRRAPQAQRKGVKPGENVVYTVGVYEIKTAATFKKQQEDYKKAMAANAKMQADFKKQQEAQAKQQKLMVANSKKQDATITAYFNANNITNAIKLPTGVYYIIDKEGEGDFVKQGFEVSMNYDGKILNGKKYDSSLDSAFGHMTPAKIMVGQRQLLQGWDEAILKFKKGSKGRIFIPSMYAYGSANYGIRPNDTIPANSIIHVDLEIVDMVDVATLAKQLAAKDDETIQAFLKEQNLTGTRTPSGLYYIITQEGTGVSPKNGDDVTMNYTGMFLDGKKFDSNEDTAFHHVSPFNFPLGQGRVIKGWDEGVAMLKKGSKAKLILPSAIAYGAGGSGSIPANSVLQFDVELVDFKKTEAPKQMPINNANIKMNQPNKK